MQSDNSIVVMGKVTRGPLISYVRSGSRNGGEVKEKLRVKYQIRIQSRVKDSNQVFLIWVRTMGNQAMKDKDNIKTGDLVLVSGRIASRFEFRKKYLYLGQSESGEPEMLEIDINDEVAISDVGIDNIYPYNTRELVNEIQANDVTYMTKMISRFENSEIRSLFDESRIKKLGEEISNSKASALKKMRIVEADEEEDEVVFDITKD